MKGHSVIQSSSLSLLGFTESTLCIAVPPGIAPKQLIAPWDKVKVLGCGKVESALALSPFEICFHSQLLVRVFNCSKMQIVIVPVLKSIGLVLRLP